MVDRAFTYVCLPLFDAVKTKLQTKGAYGICRNTFDVVAKTFQSKVILRFYNGIYVVVMGSIASSAVLN